MGSRQLALAGPSSDVFVGLPPSPGFRAVAHAILVLAVFDMIAMFRGFQGVHEWVSTTPMAISPRDDKALITRAKSAVIWACLYYPKSAACLQRSSALVRLLRLGGIAAQVVVGVQSLPFRSHAWAEYKGVVLNDGQSAPAFYAEIHRF
jgi:hypothetical protein